MNEINTQQTQTNTNGPVHLSPADLPSTPVAAPPHPFPRGSRTGDAAESAIAPTKALAREPETLDRAERATVALNAQTAWQVLFSQPGLAPQAGSAKGHRILVTAAAGSVGMWVVQLAKWLGADVVGTCETDAIEFVLSLSADVAIGYEEMSLKDWVACAGREKVDLVVDCAGGEGLGDAWWAVGMGGTLVSICQPPEQMRPAGLEGQDVRSCFFAVQPDGPQLETIAALIGESACRPVRDSVWPFEKWAEAFASANGEHATGGRG